MNNAVQTNTNIIRLPEVMAKTGLSRSSIYNLVANSDFPKRIKLSPRSIGWLQREIDLWIQARADLR